MAPGGLEHKSNVFSSSQMLLSLYHDLFYRFVKLVEPLMQRIAFVVPVVSLSMVEQPRPHLGSLSRILAEVEVT